jgi:hypothetical protein
MTRFLSEALEAPEPGFRLGIRQLEAAHGNPSTDIRFSTEVMQATKEKLRQLGLDPEDTTPEELYHALQERLKTDDARLTKRLRTEAATHVSAEGDVLAGMVHVLRELPGSGEACFALKASKLKAIIKQLPPKKAMKQLGYRSLDSLLKRETPVAVLTAAWLCEGASWQHHLLEQYRQLRPGDFEQRRISIVNLAQGQNQKQSQGQGKGKEQATQADSLRWRQLAAKVASQNRHNVLCFKELGTLVLLPFPAEAPAGAVTVSLSLALHQLNQIRTTSTFLKLCQVRPDFGSLVSKVAAEEPQFGTRLLDQPLSWQLIQHYYARMSEQFREEIFEPHIQLPDMAWQPIEEALSAIEPSFAFWQHSAHLGLGHTDLAHANSRGALDSSTALKGGHGYAATGILPQKAVSLNVIDTALNYCNQLPFERRIVHYFQQSLWHELLLRYLRRDTVEQTVLAALQPPSKLQLQPVAETAA